MLILILLLILICPSHIQSCPWNDLELLTVQYSCFCFLTSNPFISSPQWHLLSNSDEGKRDHCRCQIRVYYVWRLDGPPQGASIPWLERLVIERLVLSHCYTQLWSSAMPFYIPALLCDTYMAFSTRKMHYFVLSVDLFLGVNIVLSAQKMAVTSRCYIYCYDLVLSISA